MIVSRGDHRGDLSRQPPVYIYLTAGCAVTMDLPGPNTGRHPDTSTPCTGHKRTPDKEGNKHLLFDRCVPKQSKSSLSTSVAELVVSRLLVVTANANGIYHYVTGCTLWCMNRIASAIAVKLFMPSNISMLMF